MPCAPFVVGHECAAAFSTWKINSHSDTVTIPYVRYSHCEMWFDQFNRLSKLTGCHLNKYIFSRRLFLSITLVGVAVAPSSITAVDSFEWIAHWHVTVSIALNALHFPLIPLNVHRNCSSKPIRLEVVCANSRDNARCAAVGTRQRGGSGGNAKQIISFYCNVFSRGNVEGICM